jgi:hypothetical protein
MYSNGFTFSNCFNISKVNLLSRYHVGEDLDQIAGDVYTVYFDSTKPGAHGHILQMLREIRFFEDITLGSAVDDGTYTWLVMEYAPFSNLYRFSVEFSHFAEMTKIAMLYADLVHHLSYLEDHFRIVLDFDEPDPVSLEVISLSPVLAWRTLMDFSQQKIINLSLIGGDKFVQ